MKKSYYLILIGALSLISLQGTAQRSAAWCDSEAHFQRMAAQDPSYQMRRDVYDQKVREWIDTHPTSNKTGGPAQYKIPLVVHIMNPKDACTDIITETQVKNAVATLNRDFRMLNSDTVNTRSEFKPYAADLEMEFELARIDPNGNCTNGITRTYTDLTYDADDPVKAQSYWDATKYFNIWVVVSISSSGGGTVLGRAQFPSWTGFAGSLNTFGFLVIASEFGDANSRTATHEIGHCVGLYHTHQGGCGNSCNSSGDQVCDTPQESTQTFGCPTTLNNCDDSGTGLDGGLPSDPINPIENYMSYADCQSMFSLGQKERVDAAMAASVELSTLFTSSNLIATGIDTSLTEVPCANFLVDNCTEFVCAGTAIDFTDFSSGSAATSWNWDFGDGLTTSTDQNPSITYAAPGTYTVRLTVSDGNTSNSLTRTNYVEVKAIDGGEEAPLVENFEDSNFPDLADAVKEWTMVDDDSYNGVSWVQTSAASSSLDKCLSMRLSNKQNNLDFDLISPTIDFTNSDACTDLTFDYAYAQANSSSSEELRIYTSRDCGVSWTLVFAKPATTLSTVDGSFISGLFVPDETQWKRETISLISLTGRDHGLVRFQLTTGSGNYFYIDNIDIGCATTGIKESLSNALSVYPNPFDQDALIEFDIDQAKTMNIQIVDVVGKTLYNEQKVFSAGKNSFTLSSLTTLENGVYFLRIGKGDESVTKKIVKF